MNTTKLYRSDVYIRQWDAEITSVTPLEKEKDHYIVTLDRTAFFPEGGGQSCDTGMMGDIKVIDVQEEDGDVIHKVVSEETPEAGMKVACSLDWDRRFLNMQRHCGEHILSGIFHSLYGAVNRGFHMGKDYMTIDMSLEDKPEFTEITDEMALKAELGTNEVIWADMPVTAYHFDTRAEAEKMPLRKALAFDEDITIVCIGSVENPSDSVACCGTHPSTAGQVGLVKIYKVEKYKNMFRIYFDAGRNALMDYDFKHRILTDMSNRYSSSIEEFPDKLKVQEEKHDNVRDQLYRLKKVLIESEEKKLDEMLKASDENIFIYEVKDLDIDDAFTMSKHYMKASEKLVMIYSASSTSFVLASDGTMDCGAIVKENAKAFGGKGGGSRVSARAMFTSKKDAEAFAEKVKELS